MSAENNSPLENGRWRENPLTTFVGRRLLGWFLLLSLFPLLASTLIGYLRSHRIVEEVLEGSLEAVTQVQVQHVRNRVDRYLGFLGAVATGNEFLASGLRAARSTLPVGMESAANRSALDMYLGRQLRELEDFTDLVLVGLDGEVVASTTPFHWLDEGDAQPLLARAVEVFRVNGESDPPGLRFAVSISGILGEEEGFLVGIVGPSQLGRLFQIPEHVAGDIESFVLQEGWHPIFVSHPHGPVDYGRPLATPLRQMSFGTTSRYQDRHDVSVVGRAARISELSWIYLTEQPDSHALGALRRLRQASLFLVLTFAIFVVCAAWIVAGGIVAPIRRLADTARRLGAGDLKSRVEPGSSGEIGILNTAFNDMASDLERSALEVKDLHDREIERAAQLASVGELAAGIAHEIKNPLAGAASGLDLLEKRLDQELPTDPILKQIRSELSRIERAIRDLLSYARPREPKVGWVSPRLLADRLVALIRPQAEAKNVIVECRVAKDTPKVRVDPELLTQALVNLAMNGIQAMGPGGILTISVEDRDREVYVSVSDTGHGIPENELDQIFRPFFTTKHRGSGLGLAISRRIVERHAGRLVVESALGLGSRFTLVLPTTAGDSAT